jgi:lipoate-protein ligase A
VKPDLDWRWESREGDAATLHDPRSPETLQRTICEMRINAPAIVLGSSQPLEDIDDSAAGAAGISVVRRRSGGGAVLLIPGEHVWIDVWLPAADPLWVDDVGRAADWLADVWVAALSELGLADLAAYRGPLVRTEWSSRVCFAGLGPGEVTATERKLVGISQRRTREWARFQCLVHRQWNAAATFDLLATPGAKDAGIEWRDRVAAVDDDFLPARLERFLPA